MHRCQTFARASNNTRDVLCEAYAMRSDTEHLNSWENAVKEYPPDQRESVCLQRTWQIERLACETYSRLLRDSDLREHFRTREANDAFWRLQDDQRRELWGPPLDLA